MEKQAFQAPDISMVEALTAQLMRANQRLEQVNRELTESEQRRKDLLANISHDLRAPLTAVRSALDRLLSPDEIGGEERMQLLQVMDRRVLALEHLVRELYFSVTVEQPEFSLHLESLSAPRFLEEYYFSHLYEDRFQERELLLELPESGDGPPVRIDPHQMARVLDNLLENACRHTSSGDRITLGCRILPAGAELSMRDTGQGIAARHLPHIFERTYTGSSARSQSDGSGSGLGLAVARAIVEKHSGSIHCESKQGDGCLFVIHLPVDADA